MINFIVEKYIAFFRYENAILWRWKIFLYKFDTIATRIKKFQLIMFCWIIIITYLQDYFIQILSKRCFEKSWIKNLNFHNLRWLFVFGNDSKIDTLNVSIFVLFLHIMTILVTWHMISWNGHRNFFLLEDFLIYHCSMQLKYNTCMYSVSIIDYFVLFRNIRCSDTEPSNV